jgi:hypothetical protein
MIKLEFNSKFGQRIRLDGQQNLLRLNKKNTELLKQDKKYIFIHPNSKSYSIDDNREKSFKIMINSISFVAWYNIKIAKIMGFDIDHTNIKYWFNRIKDTKFYIEHYEKWIEVDENYFLLFLPGLDS